MPGYVPEQHDDVLRGFVAEGLAESKMPDRLRAIGVVISWRKLKEHLVRLGLAQPTKPRRPATGPPVQTPVQRVDTGAVSSVDTGAGTSADHDTAPFSQGEGGAVEHLDLGCHPG
jgi:hypothetical protein